MGSNPSREEPEAAAEPAASTGTYAQGPLTAPAATGLVALAAAARMRSAGGVGSSVPRSGRAMLARQVRGLQRTHGNAAVARMLMRSELYRTSVPPGSLDEIAAWMVNPKLAVKGRDAVVVVDGDRVLVFDAGSPPRLVQEFTRSKPDDYVLSAGVWKASGHGLDLSVYMDDAPDHWYWSWMVSKNPVEHLVVVDQRSAFAALLPDSGGSYYLAVPEPGDVTVAPAKPEVPTPADTDPKWAEKQARDARAILDKARAAHARELPPDGSQPSPGSPSYSIPDRVVSYKQGGGHQVNVWVGRGHTVVKQENGQSPSALAERIRKATAKLRASRDPRNSTRVKGSLTGEPRLGEEQVDGGIATALGQPTDPTGGRTPNAPAFPARIVSHGPEGQSGNAEFERTVTGASVNFTMDLDYASRSSGFWEEFGMRWQSIDYRWELIDISKLDLAQVRGKLAGPTSTDLRRQIAALKEEAENEPDDALRSQKQAQMAELEQQLKGIGKAADSGISRDLARSVGNTWTDTKADLHAFVRNPTVGYLDVVAISDLVQIGGALISAGISSIASPVSDRKIPFSRKGLFLLRCFAQPVITSGDIERIKRKGLEPIIRAASVALLPVEVVPINERATQVNDAEIAQIAELEKQRDNPPFPFSRAEIQQRLDLAVAAKADNNQQAVERSILGARAELKSIARWRELNRDMVPLEQRDPALRQWKAMLDLSDVDLGVYERSLNDSLVKLDKMLTRVSTGFAVKGTKGPLFRPRLTLVSELDGGVYPIMANLAEDEDSLSKRRIWRLIDLTSPDTQEPYVGRGDTHQAAIRDALDEFAGKNPYGRGSIAVRLPTDRLLAELGETITAPALLMSQPGDEERAWTRLKDLATAAEIAALFISGPIGIGIGIGGGVIGGAVAVHNMARRAAGDRLRLLDFQTAMDLLAVVGAVAGAAAPLAKGVQGAAEAAEMARLASRAKKVAGGLHIIGVGLMAGQVVFIPAALIVTLDKIDKAEQAERDAEKARGGDRPIDEAKYRAQRLEAWANFAKSGAVSIRMAQLQVDPSAGWNPLKQPLTTAPPTPAQLRGQAAAEGLTPELRDRGVTVELDRRLGNTNTVEVAYEVDPATRVVRRVRILRGAGADAADVALHAPTASAILRYSGLSGRVRVLWRQLTSLLGAKEPPLYSRAWEAKLELAKLPSIIADRTAQLADPKLDPTRREELVTELGSLEAQVAEHARTVADMNIDPGRGFVAAKGITKAQQRAKEAGLPERAGYDWRYREGGWELVSKDPQRYAPLRWNPETSEFEPVTGRKPDVRFSATMTPDDAYAALGAYDKTREFGKWVDVVTRDLGLYTHEELIAKLGDPADRMSRTVRNRIKDVVNADVVAALKDGLRLRKTDAFKAATAAGVPDAQALLEASHAELLRITDKLSPEDSGALGERWYRATFAKDATPQVAVPKSRPPFLDKDRRIDMMDGTNLREIKNVAEGLDPRARGQVTDQIRLINSQVEIPGQPARTVERVTISFLNPRGVKANRAFMLEVLRNPALKTTDVRFEIFNTRHERMEVTRANAEFLAGDGFGAWVGELAPRPKPTPVNAP